MSILTSRAFQTGEAPTPATMSKRERGALGII